MATANFFAPGFDEQVEQQNIERQRKMADLLRQQSIQGMGDGRMVGRHYVAPHWLEGIAQMLQANSARNMDTDASEKQRKLAEAVRGRTQDELGTFTKLLGGEQARDIQPLTPNDDEGNAMPVVHKDAVAPDLNAAYQYAAKAQTPALQQFGVQGALSAAQEQAKLAQAKALQQQQLQLWAQANGNAQTFIQLGGDPKLAKELAESPNYGRVKVDWKDNGSQLTPVTEYGDTPVGVKPIDKKGNPFSDLLVSDGKGGVVTNAPLVSAKEQIAKAGKPQVSVDARQYTTQETEQSKAYGKSLGEIRASINQAGWDAPKKIAQLNRMEELLKGVDGGGAAPTLASVASMANSLGIKLDPKLGPKEAAIALARDMAGSLRQPGTGPMTDKDFDNFLAQIPDLSKSAEGRAQITKTMRAAINRDLAAAKFAREYANKNKGVIDDNFFDAMANFYAENPVVTPAMPATNARGIPFSQQQIDAEIAARQKRQGGGAR